MINLLTVNLPSPVTLKVLGGKTVKIDKIVVHQILDNFYKKKIIAYCTNHPSNIVLWENEEYNKIGQWTDTDVANRILELYSNQPE